MLLRVKIDGVEKDIEQDLIPKNEEGRPVKNLLATMTDGVYDIDTEAEKIIAKENTKTSLNIWYEAEVEKIVSDIPQSERDTWTKQESEARNYLVDNTALTPLIDNIASQRGVEKDYLVGKIIEKADAYAVAIGLLTGERQKQEDSL